MLIADILHSCSDERTAEAAVASIGGDFAREMRTEAARADLTLGAHAAFLVRSFASQATERDWRDLKAATRGSDLPLLSGLAVIATTMMARRPRPGTRATAPSLAPAFPPGAASAACRVA